MRAAVVLVARHGTAAVEDILRTARVNRRIFYRHFATKDALLAAIAEEAAATVEHELAGAVSVSPAAAAAQAWVERYLERAWDPGAAGAARAFLAPDSTAGAAVGDVIEAAHERHRELLVDVLRRGRADGSLPAADPGPDAFTVHAAVLRHVELRLRGRSRTDLETARSSVTGVLRRLGGA